MGRNPLNKARVVTVVFYCEIIINSCENRLHNVNDASMEKYQYRLVLK